jgi:hypothetical protein
MVYALRDIHGRKYPLGTKLQIGSDLSNQIVLLDPKVAPVHAMLWEQEGSLFLQDGSGGSATFVNQMRVQGTVTLRVGDKVTTGSTVFTVDDLNAAQPAASADAPKKGIGCLKWLLIGVAMFMAGCVLLAASGFFLYSTDVQLQGDVRRWQQVFFDTPENVIANSLTTKDQPGPDLLALDDLALISNFTSSFSQHQEITGESYTPDGAAILTSLVADSMQQLSPYWSSYILAKEVVNGKVITQFESGIAKGVVYSVSPTCEPYPDPEPGKPRSDYTPSKIFTNEPSGYVKLIEKGVTINGVITDRYEFKRDNFTASGVVVGFKSGSLYRARDGGYLVRLEYVVVITPQSWAINVGDQYSTTETTLVTFVFERTYAPEGTLTIKVPEACADQVK